MESMYRFKTSNSRVKWKSRVGNNKKKRGGKERGDARYTARHVCTNNVPIDGQDNG